MTDTPQPKTRRLQTVAVLPSLMTLGNLLCGFAAVFYAARPDTIDGHANLVLGSWQPISFAASLIFIGMLFDAIDGRLARLTGQTSRFGAQLDSMADMVTFGVAPAFVVIQFVDQLVNIGTPFISERADLYFGRAVLIIGAIYVACAGLRLARYTVETHDSTRQSLPAFKGLPSPGAGGAVASLVLLYQWIAVHNTSTFWSYTAAICMVTLTLLVALAMVSTLPYVHVVNRYLRDRGPFQYIVAGVIVALLLLTVAQLTVALAFVLYALSAPVSRACFGQRCEPPFDESDEDADPPTEPPDRIP